MKTCTKCLQSKAYVEFHTYRPSKDGYNARCKKCISEYQREYYMKNSERVRTRASNAYASIPPREKRDRQLRWKYGITLEHYEEILQSQGGVCAICKQITNGHGSLHVDHNHTCCPGQKSCGQCIRGLLCSSCNIGIGNLREDVETLRSAIKYLGG